MKFENNDFTCALSKIKSLSWPKGLGNYLILDKTHVTLFCNITRHHLITDTNDSKIVIVLAPQVTLFYLNNIVIVVVFQVISRNPRREKPMCFHLVGSLQSEELRVKTWEIGENDQKKKE